MIIGLTEGYWWPYWEHKVTYIPGGMFKLSDGVAGAGSENTFLYLLVR